MTIDRNNTSLSAEYFVAAELYRRGFSVGITLGNAKSIDMLAEKGGKSLKIQVKGIQSPKSICWNLKREQIDQSPDFFYVLVNLNANSFEEPEFFILSGPEAFKETKPTNSGRDYIDIGPLRKKSHSYKGNWGKLDIGETVQISPSSSLKAAPSLLNLERHLERIVKEEDELLQKLA